MAYAAQWTATGQCALTAVKYACNRLTEAEGQRVLHLRLWSQPCDPKSCWPRAKLPPEATRRCTCLYQGCGVIRSRRVLGGVGVGFFCPTPDVQLDHFLHHTPKLGIPVEMVQFLVKLLLKQISCCAPRFPLILTVKFHSLYVNEAESDILPPTATLVRTLFFKQHVQWITKLSFRSSILFEAR